MPGRIASVAATAAFTGAAVYWLVGAVRDYNQVTQYPSIAAYDVVGKLMTYRGRTPDEARRQFSCDDPMTCRFLAVTVPGVPACFEYQSISAPYGSGHLQIFSTEDQAQFSRQKTFYAASGMRALAEFPGIQAGPIQYDCNNTRFATVIERFKAQDAASDVLIEKSWGELKVVQQRMAAQAVRDQGRPMTVDLPAVILERTPPSPGPAPTGPKYACVPTHRQAGRVTYRQPICIGR